MHKEVCRSIYRTSLKAATRLVPDLTPAQFTCLVDDAVAELGYAHTPVNMAHQSCNVVRKLRKEEDPARWVAGFFTLEEVTDDGPDQDAARFHEQCAYLREAGFGHWGA